MNGPCMEFCSRYLSENEVAHRSILEVGANDQNGSWRYIIQPYKPKEYTPIDLNPGRGVGLQCDVNNLETFFGPDRFDIVLSAEMLEHVQDWKSAIHNIKAVLRPGGTIMLTTRSYWFPYHGCPKDYWRFESEDMIHIFSDFKIKALIPDYLMPGIFIKAIKPIDNYQEVDLTNFEVADISNQGWFDQNPENQKTPTLGEEVGNGTEC